MDQEQPQVRSGILVLSEVREHAGLFGLYRKVLPPSPDEDLIAPLAEWEPDPSPLDVSQGHD